jgi:hypothetical protein
MTPAIELIRNLNAYPPEKLQHYVGQYVAWSENGKEILMGDPDLGNLLEKLKGVDPETYILDYIERPWEPVDPQEAARLYAELIKPAQP